MCCLMTHLVSHVSYRSSDICVATHLAWHTGAQLDAVASGCGGPFRQLRQRNSARKEHGPRYHRWRFTTFLTFLCRVTILLTFLCRFTTLLTFLCTTSSLKKNAPRTIWETFWTPFSKVETKYRLCRHDLHRETWLMYIERHDSCSGPYSER